MRQAKYKEKTLKKKIIKESKNSQKQPKTPKTAKNSQKMNKYTQTPSYLDYGHSS